MLIIPFRPKNQTLMNEFLLRRSCKISVTININTISKCGVTAKQAVLRLHRTLKSSIEV